MSINNRKHKSIMAFLHNEILFSNVNRKLTNAFETGIESYKCNDI